MQKAIEAINKMGKVGKNIMLVIYLLKSQHDF